nr:cuticle protein 19.8-like [Lepeophtheirus salmonis]
MLAKILIACLAVNIALVASAPSSPPSYSPYPPPPPPPPAPVSYGYNYGVVDDESGVNISADELAENGVVSGSYKVVLPDGRMKIVTYTVEGDSGFVADVQFEAAPVLAAAPPPPYPKYTPYPA